jgi:hypothetical protein
MSITPTSLLRYLKRKLGASHRPLPLNDKDILDIVMEESIYTFSKYYPLMWGFDIDPIKDKVPGKEGVYFIRSKETEGVELLGVAKVFRGETMYNTRRIFMDSAGNAANVQMLTDLLSFTDIPDTFEFIPPNKVEVFPKFIDSRGFMVVGKIVHPKHFGTIPLSLREEFFKLAEYDVKDSLWQILKRMGNMNTAFATLDLKLEDLEQAEDRKKELLDDWDTKFIREANRKKIYVY